MPLRDGARRLYRAFDKGVSYISGDIGDKLIDAQNFIILQNKLQTRPGLKKFTSAAFSEAPQSLSFYKKDSGAKKVLAKTGATLQAADPETGIFSSIKSGLSAANIHDAVNMLGRHIVALGSDGLYEYDGTTFDSLGAAAPNAPVAVIAGGGSLTQPKDYVVAITFESSVTGFETNSGAASATCSSSGGTQTISVSSIPVSTNGFFDLKNIYLKNVTDSGAYLLVAQIANATTTYSITANPSAASSSPPTGKDTPLAGGAKYLAIYNSQLVAAGNTNFKSDIFFSNTDEPEGWSTSNTLVHVNGDGPITGLAVGYYSGGNIDLNQYLVGFKKRSITVYYQSIAGPTEDQQINIDGVGCVSHKTIRVKDGNIYFLSDYGWRVIVNGSLLPQTMGNGDIDDIFRISGFTYGLNKQILSNAFATYYSELDSYMCWVAEGANNSFNKCYNWHMDAKQWMPLIMANSTCAVTGEDTNGQETVYIGNNDRNIYRYSIRNEFSDDITTHGFTLDIDKLDVGLLQAESASSIPVFALFNWQPNEDFDASYNFRDLIIEGISDTDTEESTFEVKAYLNFSRSISYSYDYDLFSSEGFTLDVSRLDIDILGDERARVRMGSDINRTARNILFGIYQDTIEAKLQLLAYQLNFSKNGNRN